MDSNNLKIRPRAWTALAVAIAIAAIAIAPVAAAEAQKKAARKYDLKTFFSTAKTMGAAVSPDDSTVAYVTDRSGVFNIWTVPATGGEAKQLTNFTDTVRLVTYTPNDRFILFQRDKGGDENDHIFKMPMAGGPETDLTPGDKVKAGFAGWLHDGNAFIYISNARDERIFDVYRMDAKSWKAEMIYQNDGPDQLSGFNRDGSLLAFDRFNVLTDQDIYLYDVATKNKSNITQHEGEVFNSFMDFSPDGRTVYFTSDQGGEFQSLKKMDVATKKVDAALDTGWDVLFAGFSRNGTYFISGVNEDGATKISIRDEKTGKPVALPSLPGGEVRGPQFSFSERYLTMYFMGDTRPNDLHVMDLSNGKLARLTNSLPKEIDSDHLVESRLIRYQASDGRKIPAYLYVPQGMQVGEKRSAIVWVHGGPAAQARPGYSALQQYFVNQGFVILMPNVRGSTGYGKTYQTLDDHDWGGAPLQDVVSAKKYLESLGYVDPSKVVILGGSYGGYMVLSALTREPTAFAAGVDICGPSNLDTLLASIPPYWEPFKKYFRREVGDPVKDKAFLAERSPLFSASKIVRPLFVIQGANDPRVKQPESDMIVEAIRKRQGIVDYMVFEDEGHGLLKVANQIKAYEAVKGFLDTYVVNAKDREMVGASTTGP